MQRTTCLSLCALALTGTIVSAKAQDTTATAVPLAPTVATTAPLTLPIIPTRATTVSANGNVPFLLASAAPVTANASAAVGSAPGPDTSSDKIDSRHWTFWLFGSLGFDYRPGGANSAVSFGLGVAGVITKTSSSSTLDSTGLNGINIGLEGEAFYYPSHKGSGLAFNLRVGTANSIYVAPGIFYVSRPKGSILGRFGIMAPIGGGAVPFYPEAGLGVRF